MLLLIARLSFRAVGVVVMQW